MLAPLSRLLLDLHPALLLLLLLDFLLLILLLTPFVVSGFGLRAPAAQSLRTRGRAAGLCSCDGVGSSAAAVGERAAPPPCRSLFEDKASESDITIAPAPPRTPPVKSFVSVQNKSLIQVRVSQVLEIRRIA